MITPAYPSHMIEDLKPGEHLCYIYETEEEHRVVLTPFLRRGLERGEKVLYIVDAHASEAILAYLQDGGLDVEPTWQAGSWPSSPATTPASGKGSLTQRG